MQSSCLRCVISFFYIKPQQKKDAIELAQSCVISFFYIKPQHYASSTLSCYCCVISFFYIKPQLFWNNKILQFSCVISFFYIKPQLFWNNKILQFSCVISFFYIKPQPSKSRCEIAPVVLYLSSTSNHNARNSPLKKFAVVLYLSSTSNHNPSCEPKFRNGLCYIFLLHQTTTRILRFCALKSCVISFFYIKPQLCIGFLYMHRVVLYLSSTSNHNVVVILPTQC